MASITCGNCKETHESVSQVRACYGGRPTPVVVTAVSRDETATLPTVDSEPKVTEGMYRVGDVVYKVQAAIHGSGRLYAKRLHGQSFVYEKGAIYRLKPENKMTLEDAKEWGLLYGTCCVCGRTLTDETSIANGIGPVCAGKGWW